MRKNILQACLLLPGQALGFFIFISSGFAKGFYFFIQSLLFIFIPLVAQLGYWIGLFSSEKLDLRIFSYSFLIIIIVAFLLLQIPLIILEGFDDGNAFLSLSLHFHVCSHLKGALLFWEVF